MGMIPKDTQRKPNKEKRNWKKEEPNSSPKTNKQIKTTTSINNHNEDYDNKT